MATIEKIPLPTPLPPPPEYQISLTAQEANGLFTLLVCGVAARDLDKLHLQSLTNLLISTGDLVRLYDAELFSSFAELKQYKF